MQAFIAGCDAIERALLFRVEGGVEYASVHLRKGEARLTEPALGRKAHG